MTEAAPAPPAFPAEWRIVAAELMADTVSSHVWLVHRADGGRAVVKDCKPIPDLADVLRGARYLAWREGDGAARLLAEHGRMMLIEHAGNHMLAEEIATAGDAAATRIAADLLAHLLAPAPVPDAADFQPLHGASPACSPRPMPTARRAGRGSMARPPRSPSGSPPRRRAVCRCTATCTTRTS
ncbi:Aminoglycoside/hydroxyurea antibiotic resistance kinase [bacterium YEK0313]|nr:Aminoglycoside/hydroxyurea antibiotic resistance kinase [bacterium YEK0313]